MAYRRLPYRETEVFCRKVFPDGTDAGEDGFDKGFADDVFVVLLVGEESERRTLQGHDRPHDFRREKGAELTDS